MALSRPRRSNAGSKMATLLNSMEADDFYTTTYGGFAEDESDEDFACEAVPGTGAVVADVDDDIVDSDFSIDENDEPRSDVENSDDPDHPKKLKRGQGVQTKAYKEPKRDQVDSLASFRFNCIYVCFVKCVGNLYSSILTTIHISALISKKFYEIKKTTTGSTNDRNVERKLKS